MATSNALSTSNSNVKYKITITQNKRDIGTNTSSVTVTVRFYRTDTGSATYGSGKVYCKIDGTTYSANVTSSQKITSSGINLFSKTLDIEHNADGSKRLTTSAWINIDTPSSSEEQSYSQILKTIPRASTPSVNVTSIDLGKDIIISIDRASTAFTHTLLYTFGGSSGTIGTGVTTSKPWTIPLSLANKIPSTIQGVLTITCDTYNGSNKIGSKKVSITVKVPSTVKPTISGIVVAESVSSIATKFKAFLKGKSKPTISVNASGTYGSTIKKYAIKFDGQSYTAKSFTAPPISASGSLPLSVTVTDSRGRTATRNETVNVLDYFSPDIISFTVQRCNKDGVINDEGEYVSIKYALKISPVNNLNDKSYKISYKKPADPSYIDLKTESVYTVDTTYISTVIFESDSAYDLRLTVSDFFKTVNQVIEVPTAFTLIDFHASGKGMAFGKVAEIENGTEFGLKALFKNGETSQGAVILKGGENLDNLIDPGYYVFSSTVSSTLVNLPLTESASGSIEIFREGDAGQVRQLVTRCSTDREIWERLYYSNKWQPWVLVYRGGDRILWSGEAYMFGTQSIDLMKPVSAQENGIVLVFSGYNTGVQNYHFNSFFIHKKTVELHDGNGHSFFMTDNGELNDVAIKYLHIKDTIITGHDNNKLTGTGASGISYKNNLYVLRYVIGV